MYYNYIRYNTTPQFKSINSLVLTQRKINTVSYHVVESEKALVRKRE